MDGHGGRLHAYRVDEILNLLGVGLEVIDDALIALVGDELEYLLISRGARRVSIMYCNATQDK